ncbi:flavin reductase family protein [Nocardia mikamii]|uniref:flavin reductase family protein n=1 Tax=Nocardia mikamii TaxID=508464 RepID=UPI000A02A333|nr:flavin reductase family protein [Nocardia mikamii]
MPEGSVFIKKSSVWLECSVSPGIPAGDHTIALLEIHGLRMGFERSLSVFHGSRFRRLAAIQAPRSPGNDRPPLRAEHP